MWSCLEYQKALGLLILISQASVRSGIVGNVTSALTAQKAFLNNFEDIVNRRVDIRKISSITKTLSYASSKVITEWEKIFICCLAI